MSSYILKDSKKKAITKVEVKTSYSFNPAKYKKIKTIKVYDEEKINKILCNNLLKKYAKLKNIVTSLEEDDNPTDFYLVLGEVNKLLSMLETKYKSFLKREAYNLFLEKLLKERNFLEAKIYDLDLEDKKTR